MTAMLATLPVVSFLATRDAARARSFFVDTLGLEPVSEDAHAVVLKTASGLLRLQKVKDFTPHPFTALGWEVTDIVASVRALAARGVVFERFGFFEQDADAIWTAPNGARVAWFKDPDGNTLSLSTH
jgi:catechol 2,3-dioxygenase-like lactoylglutathione lyase family enzyme